MGRDGLHRLRWPAHPHRVAAQTVRAGAPVADRRRLRGRDRRHQPAARTGLHPAGHLVRLAAARPARRHRRRGVLHRPRPDPHPCPGRSVPGGASAPPGDGRRCRGRGISARLRQGAVDPDRGMTGTQFLDAVALGQITPGPVVQTVAVVGYAAAGIGGGLLAALVAFAPSFAFVLLGGRHFDRLRDAPRVQAFLTGAGAAAIGALAGSTIPLALALTHLWQDGLLAPAPLWLLPLRRAVGTPLLAPGTP